MYNAYMWMISITPIEEVDQILNRKTYEESDSYQSNFNVFKSYSMETK